MNNPVSISLCMIVKNEEDNLRKSLYAVKDFIDEIIIVDTGSTDNTVEIAKKFNAKVFHYVWNDDFSTARNFAIKQASCDWVLNLDADHVFNWNNQLSLKQTLQESSSLGLMINERTLNTEGEFQELSRLLLIKNHCGFKYTGYIFEHPLKSIKEYAQKNKIAQPFSTINNCRVDHINIVNLNKISQSNVPVLQKAIKKAPDNFEYRYKYLLTLKDLFRTDQYKNELLNAVYRIEQMNSVLNESIVAIWGLFGEWVIEDNNSDAVEKFYKNAKTFAEESKWSDIRLIWPYVKVSIMQHNFEKAISDLKKCIENGIMPDHVTHSDHDLIAPVYQLIKLVNNQKPAEDFITLINDISKLIAKTNLDENKIFLFIEKNDQELFAEIFNIISKEKRDGLEKEYEDKIAEKQSQKQNQPLLSLCMIVKNEQKNLGHCLKSVKDVVDEIIIVDTGSTDNCVEIAQKFNSKIIYTQWHNDFSEARNLALEMASGKWILHLDADEELNSASVNQLVTKLLTSKADAINVVLRNHQPKEDIVSFLDEQQVRLFLNKPNYRYRNKVHEQIIPSIADNSGIFEESDIIIDHYGYQTNNVQRAKRNLDLLQDELQEFPDDAYLLFKMGETYKALKKWDKATEYLTKALRNPRGNITNEIKEVIYLRLGQIELAKDNHSSAQEYASACLRCNGKNAMAKYILGITMMYSNQVDKGIKLFVELKKTQHIHRLDLSEIDRLLEVFENMRSEEKVFN
jgi:glycosyltransferase involved in cell wall biosynthesis